MKIKTPKTSRRCKVQIDKSALPPPPPPPLHSFVCGRFVSGAHTMNTIQGDFLCFFSSIRLVAIARVDCSFALRSSLGEWRKSFFRFIRSSNSGHAVVVTENQHNVYSALSYPSRARNMLTKDTRVVPHMRICRAA